MLSNNKEESRRQYKPLVIGSSAEERSDVHDYTVLGLHLHKIAHFSYKFTLYIFKISER